MDRLQKEKMVENPELPQFSVDTLFAMEERIYEISRGHLFKGTVIDFDAVVDDWG